MRQKEDENSVLAVDGTPSECLWSFLKRAFNHEKLILFSGYDTRGSVLIARVNVSLIIISLSNVI